MYFILSSTIVLSAASSIFDCQLLYYLLGEIENQLNTLNVPCSVFPESQSCTTDAPTASSFDPLDLLRSVSLLSINI